MRAEEKVGGDGKPEKRISRKANLSCRGAR